jgi:hypothetical protein
MAFFPKKNNVVVQGTTVRPVAIVQGATKPRSATIQPAKVPNKGTAARVIGSFAANYTNSGGALISSGTSLEHRRGLVQKK